MNNKQIQAEELEALDSIYSEQWKREIDGENSYSIEINSNVKLYITLSDLYPLQGPPTYQLLAPSLNKQKKTEIANFLDMIYLDNLGEPVLFQWIEKLKELVDTTAIELESSNLGETGTNKYETTSQLNDLNISSNYSKKIIHGTTITDRKSTFQGHVCDVDSLEDVNAALAKLMENKKIAQATHNIYAYVIKQASGNSLQDYDDDGESHAGGRLLHLLQILKVTNVLVVVSRWYGGIHLGPDRFRHINNAARQALCESRHIIKDQ